MSLLEERDLRVFADIGTEFGVSVDGQIKSFSLVMAGERVVVSQDAATGVIVCKVGDAHTKFSGTKSFLADERFGDLKRWASSQNAYLSQFIPTSPISCGGLYKQRYDDQNSCLVDSDELNRKISEGDPLPLHVVVMDGPAGIGKTTQIRQLAASRASSFVTEHGRLILHVESRGRVLQNINDLIAASLQTIRAKPTYDQLAILVRHGLVTLAIDGFDELADPNGYQLAWAQINELLSDVFGNGQVILAGRETFVSPLRMMGALTILSRSDTVLSHCRLTEIDPSAARRWLEDQGWSAEALQDERLKELLAPGSYALRPFFLSMISGSDFLNQLVEDESIDLLPLLINQLITRESSKFGDDVVRVFPKDRIERYLRDLCEEIARDMADNQGEVMPGQAVSFAAEICLPGDLDQSIKLTLIHRAPSMPFLTIDASKNSIRFSHRQFMVYFLGCNAIKAVSHGEVPKYLRRNILGSEFLESFSRVIRAVFLEDARKFVSVSADYLNKAGRLDRSAGNVASLLLTGAGEIGVESAIRISNVHIDEVLIGGALSSIELNSVYISSMYAVGSDLRNVIFSGESSVFTLYASSLTSVGNTFPKPSFVELESGESIGSPDKISAWLAARSGAVQSTPSSKAVPFSDDLLERILRYRSFWLRDDAGEEAYGAKKIVTHPDWESAKTWLKDNNLARFDQRQPSSGSPAVFIHFRVDDIRRFLS